MRRPSSPSYGTPYVRNTMPPASLRSARPASRYNSRPIGSRTPSSPWDAASSTHSSSTNGRSMGGRSSASNVYASLLDDEEEEQLDMDMGLYNREKKKKVRKGHGSSRKQRQEDKANRAAFLELSTWFKTVKKVRLISCAVWCGVALLLLLALVACTAPTALANLLSSSGIFSLVLLCGANGFLLVTFFRMASGMLFYFSFSFSCLRVTCLSCCVHLFLSGSVFNLLTTYSLTRFSCSTVFAVRRTTRSWFQHIMYLVTSPQSWVVQATFLASAFTAVGLFQRVFGFSRSLWAIVSFEGELHDRLRLHSDAVLLLSGVAVMAWTSAIRHLIADGFLVSFPSFQVCFGLESVLSFTPSLSLWFCAFTQLLLFLTTSCFLPCLCL